MYQPQLACLGLSHQTAPVALRERAACTLEDLKTAQRQPNFAGIYEYAILSTCNRLELYAALDPAIDDTEQALTAFLAAATGADAGELRGHSYFFSGTASVNHLARVAAGLESLILGESQILGQVSRAHAEAMAARTICQVLDALMLTAMRAGKRVHAETHISRKPVSISSVAVGTAERHFGSLRQRAVLLVGLGEMGTYALKTLKGRGAERILVANRTVARAQRVADEHGATAYGLDQLPRALASADVVISATSGQGCMIDAAMVATAQAQRHHRPLLLIDIAVPRDIDPAAAAVDGVHYYDIDHLNRGVDDALAVRQREVPYAEAIVAEECADFDEVLRRLAVEPIIADFRQRAERVRQQEVARTLRFMGLDADEELAAHVEHLSRTLVNKLLHAPTVRLKDQVGSGQADPAYLTAFSDLFDLALDASIPPVCAPSALAQPDGVDDCQLDAALTLRSAPQKPTSHGHASSQPGNASHNHLNGKNPS